MGDRRFREPLDGLTRWWVALLAVLAVDYLVLAIGSRGSDRLLALMGAVLIGTAVASAIARRPRVTVGLVALASLPLAIATPWSIVTPALAVVAVSVALALGWRLHRRPPRAARPASSG